MQTNSNVEGTETTSLAETPSRRIYFRDIHGENIHPWSMKLIIKKKQNYKAPKIGRLKKNQRKSKAMEVLENILPKVEKSATEEGKSSNYYRDTGS